MTSQPTPLKPNHSLQRKQFPYYKKPSIVGYFSVDGDRRYMPNGVHCKYLKMPINKDRVHFDLNKGYQLAIKKPPNNEKIDNLLNFISQNLRRNNRFSTQIIEPQIVCFRGLLKDLMCTPYEKQDGWCILATRYRGTTYMCAHETDEKRHKKESETNELKKILSYGFKFEQYMMTDDPKVKPCSDVPVNECEEFCCMFETQLDEYRLLIGAEMDGIESDGAIDIETVDLNQLKFVELKVNLRPRNHQKYQNYLRYKVLKWWCQSFLVGVSRIIVGQRTDRGIVDKVTVLDINEEITKAQDFWSDAVCLNFCRSFLKLVQSEMVDVDSAKTVYKFEYHPIKMKAVEVTRMGPGNAYTFLPEWYVEWLNTKSKCTKATGS